LDLRETMSKTIVARAMVEIGICQQDLFGDIALRSPPSGASASLVRPRSRLQKPADGLGASSRAAALIPPSGFRFLSSTPSEEVGADRSPYPKIVLEVADGISRKWN
jgi:hypothetical protein